MGDMRQSGECDYSIDEPPEHRRQAHLLLKLKCHATRRLRAVGDFVMLRPLLWGAFVLVGMSATASQLPFEGVRSEHVLLGGEYVQEYVAEEKARKDDPLGDMLIASAAPMGRSSPVVADEAEVRYDLALVPWRPLVAHGGGSNGQVREYTVQAGDTLSGIAASFEVAMLALAISNDIVDPDAIQPGDTLRIPPRFAGANHTLLHIVKKGETLSGIAKEYGANTDMIIAANGLPADGTITVGDELVVPLDTLPEPAKPAPTPAPSPSPRAPTPPRFASRPSTLGYFIAPTTGRNYGRIHSNNGVDIANSCGTPIYAAAAGSITRADGSGWNGGYGIVIDIRHANGTATRYAHLSQILVWGGSVGQGQLIGFMGTTGRSTGCHLHFEVHGARNPLAR